MITETAETLTPGVAQHLLTHRLISIDGFLPLEVCQRLYDEMTKFARFSESTVSDRRGDDHAQHDTPYQSIKQQGRISETAFSTSYSAAARHALDVIRGNVAGLLGVEPRRFEPWQCTRYFTGGKFDYHDDCGNWGSNERLYTCMVTLRAPDFGGATHFRYLNRSVESRAGRLLLWRNLDENERCHNLMSHSGTPVGKPGTDDEKMIIVTWIRRFDYVS